MAIKLNIQKFSGAGTETARRKAQAISDNYGNIIDAIQTSWNKVDEWASANASGETLKKKMHATAEFLNGIPEPDGNNANIVLQERTDKIINDANYEDQVNNNGEAQVSNPFEQRHLSCNENVPASRSYNGIDDFRGLTDEGVANIETLYNSLGELETKAGELFDLMGQGSVGTHITGLNLSDSFRSKMDTDKTTLNENISEVKTTIDNYIQEQEEASKSVSDY